MIAFASPGSTVDNVIAFDGPLFDAIADASAKGIPVMNLSLGGILDRTDPQQDASWRAWNRVANLATRKGTLIIAAAGNESLRTGGTLASVPADLPAVVSVSATATSKLVGPFRMGDGSNPPVWGPLDAAPSSDKLAAYSNYGRPVDVAAPGGDCGPTFDGTPGDGAEAQRSSAPVRRERHRRRGASNALSEFTARRSHALRRIPMPR